MKLTHVFALALSLLTAGSAFADSMYLRQLPHSDSFRKVADAIGTRLRDEVISTGTFDIGAMHVIGAPAKLTAKHLATLNLDLVGKIAKLHDDKVPADLARNTTVEPFSGTVVKAAGRHLASVYAYTPGNGESDRLTRTIFVLTSKCGITPKNGQVVTSRSRFYDAGSQSKKYFTQTLFLNTETNRALVLYMISGTM